MQSHFNDRSGVLAAERQAVELDGLNAAISGSENGFNAGHLSALNSDGLPVNKRGKEKADDALDIILTTMPYEQLLRETHQRLSDAENAVDRLIERATERFETAQEALSEIEAQSAQLPDGTRVARSSDGHIYAIENGQRISPEEAATIVWRGDEPSLEAIEAQRDRAHTAFEVLERARVNEGRLGAIREELSGEEPSRDRLLDLQEEIEGISIEAEQSLTLVADMDMDKPNAPTFSSIENAVIPSI